MTAEPGRQIRPPGTAPRLPGQRRPDADAEPRVAFLAREVSGRAAGLLFAAIAAFSTVFMLARLFVGGTIGLSDQGDGTRLLCSLGLRQGNPYDASPRDFLYPVWPDHTWFGEDCGASGTGERVHSSQLLLAGLAKGLTHLLTPTDGLDLRVLGVLLSLLTGLLVAGIAVSLPGRMLGRLVLAGVLLLVVADGTFAGYLVSAYAEPAGILGLLALVVAAFWFLRTDRVTWWGIAAVCAATLLTVTSTTRAMPLLVAVLPLLLTRPSREPGVRERLAEWRSAERPDEDEFDDDSPDRVRRAEFFARSRWPALLVCAGMLAVSAAWSAAQPERLRVQDDYAAVFVEMLPHSPHGAQDLERMGLPADMASSARLPISAANGAAARPDFYGFTEHAGAWDRLPVYLTRPTRLVGMMFRGFDGMSRLRADYVYSYPESAGRGPGQFECRVCVVQKVWKAVFFKGSPFHFVVWACCLVLCGLTARTRAERSARAVGGVGVLLAAAVAAQFWGVLLSTGASDLIKQLALTNLTMMLMIVLTGASVRALRHTPRREKAGPTRYGW